MSWQTNNYRGGYNTSRAAYAPGSTDISTKGELIAKVYGLMGLSVLASLPGVWVGAKNMWVVESLGGFGFLVVVLAWYGIIYAASSLARTPGINMLMLLVVGFSTGFVLSFMLVATALTQGTGIIAQALIISLGVFGGLSAYAIISKKNFNFLYGFISAGFSGMFVLWLLMMFGGMFGLGNLSFIHLLWCWIGLIVVSAGVLFKTSHLVRDGVEENAVLYAISLYLSLVNIFIFILSILSRSRD